MSFSLFKVFHHILFAEIKYHLRHKQDIFTLCLFFLSIFFLLHFTFDGEQAHSVFLNCQYIWISLFFSFFIAQEKFLEPEFQKKLFDHLLLSPLQLEIFFIAKIIGFWCGRLVWLIAFSALLLIATQVAIKTIAWILVTLALGSLNFLLIGTLAITLTRTNIASTSLFALIVFPFYLPTYIFGILTVNAHLQSDQLEISPWPYFQFEIGLCLLYFAIVPFLSAKLIKFRTEE